MMPQTKKWMGLTLLGALILTIQPLWAQKFEIDAAHSDVSFKIKHMVVSKVSGRFDKFSGSFNYDEKDMKSWDASAMIETSSINTANENRDKHLRTAEFFDTEKFPQMTFKSTKVTDLKDNKAKLYGDLSLHGITKPVILDLEIGGVIKGPGGVTKSGFTATTNINRKDYGIVWSKTLETGGVMIGDMVEISINIEGTAK